MKKLFFTLLLFSTCFQNLKAQVQIPDDYQFNGYPVSRNVIEAYLNRAMTMSSMLTYENVSGNYIPTLYGGPPFGPINISKLQQDPDVQANLQLIQNLRPKYIHRADGWWARDKIYSPLYNNIVSPFWDCVNWMANEVHQIDEEIILEAGLFEAVESWDCAEEYLADTFNLPLITIDPNDLTTNYIYNYFPELNNQPFTITRYDMLYVEEQNAINSGTILKDRWYVPDISKLATRVWWFYRACEYVRRGYESIHMGRMDLMLKRDQDNILVNELMDRIRAFGATINPSTGETYARRGVVFFNSCTSESEPQQQYHSGIYPTSSQFTISSSTYDHIDKYVKVECVYHGNQDEKKLLWDWGSTFIGIAENNTGTLSSINQLIDVTIYTNGDPNLAGHGFEPTYGTSAGGIHPQGWICDHLPYYVEWDCSNGFDLPAAPYIFTPYNKIYGMDERTWFMSINQVSDRENILEYIYERVKCLDRNAFLMMPGMWQGYFKYNTTTSNFDRMIYRADKPQFGVDAKILDLWNTNSGNYHPDRNERFVCVNRRDGSLWNSLPAYPAFYYGEKGFTGDFNRDGLDDLLSIPNNEPGVGVQWPDAHRVYETKPSGDDFDYLGTVNVTNPCGTGPYFSWGENIYVGDFDGDGFRDEVAVVANKSLGVTCPAGVRIYKATTSWNSTLGRFSFSGFQFKLSLASPSYTEKLHIGDFNGDGKDDILCIADNSPAVGSNWSGFKIFLSTSTSSAHSFAAPLSYSSGTSTYPTSWGEEFYIGDFNGDGTDDFFVVANNALGTNWQGVHLYITQVSLGTPQFNYVGDMSCNSSGCFPSWGEQYYVGDYNGDGLDDIIFTADNHVGINWQGYHVFMNKYSNGTYWFDDKGQDGCMQCCYPSWGERFNIGDFNGDGLSDFLVSSDATLGIWGGGWSMYRSKGSNGVWKPSRVQNEENNNSLIQVNAQGEKPESLIAFKEEVVLYPNPATSKIHVKLIGMHDKDALIQVKLFDMLGKCIGTLYDGKADGLNKALSLPNVTSGIYTVQITNEKNITKYKTLSIQ